MNGVKIILWHQEVCEIITEIKLMGLMAMLYRVNNLSIKKITEKKNPEQSPQPGNEGDDKQSEQLPVPNLHLEVTIPLSYLSNFCRYLDLPLIINCEAELHLSRENYCILV